VRGSVLEDAEGLRSLPLESDAAPSKCLGRRPSSRPRRTLRTRSMVRRDSGRTAQHSHMEAVYDEMLCEHKAGAR